MSVARRMGASSVDRATREVRSWRCTSQVLRLLGASLPRSDSSLPTLVRTIGEAGASYRHSQNRPFLHHLLGTARILLVWRQSRTLIRAALFHSAYSTDEFPNAMFSFNEREALSSLIGASAERRVFLFCTLDRPRLLNQLSQLHSIPANGVVAFDFRTGRRRRLSRRAVADYLLLEMANYAEQLGLETAAGQWMATCCSWAHLVRPHAQSVPPVFSNCRRKLTASAEADSRGWYLQGVTQLESKPRKAAEALARSSSRNPWVAEPKILLARLAIRAGEHRRASRLADDAMRLLCAWGTAWDKRVGWADWLSDAVMLRGMALEGGQRRSSSRPDWEQRACAILRQINF